MDSGVYNISVFFNGLSSFTSYTQLYTNNVGLKNRRAGNVGFKDQKHPKINCINIPQFFRQVKKVYIENNSFLSDQ